MLLIALLRVGGPCPSKNTRQENALARDSALIRDMHTFFHRVAGMRITTTYGLLSDDPTDNTRRRDEAYGIRRE